MAQISFTSNLRRHVDCPDEAIPAENLHDLLQEYFGRHTGVEGYVLNDQGELRKHVVIFVDGAPANDRLNFTDVLGGDSQVFVFQALSGG